jgi:hypothetical protein
MVIFPVTGTKYLVGNNIIDVHIGFLAYRVRAIKTGGY